MNDHRTITFGDYVVDLDSGMVFRGDREIQLRPKSFAVLTYLAERPGQLVSKDELMTAIWDGVVVTDGALTQCILDIRRALGDSGVIRTVPRRGYIFAFPTEGPSTGETVRSDSRGARRPGPVRLAALSVALGTAVIAVVLFLSSSPEKSHDSTLAVLAFQDLTSTADRAYLAEGLAEEILNKLAQVRGLQLVSRTSSFSLDGAQGGARSIGQQLGATHLLEGSVRVENGRMRVIARLVDADSGYESWAGDFNAEESDLITIQETIAASIAYELRGELVPADVSAAIEISTDDPVAYDLYLQAKELLRNRRDISGIDRALAKLDEALIRAPLFAEAEAAKCEAYRTKLNQTRDYDYLDPAIRACRRAIDLRPQLLEARIALGRLLDRTGQDELARRVLTETVDRHPNSAQGHWALAETFFALDDVESARQHFEKALELDPSSPNVLGGHARFLSRVESLDSALPFFERAIAAAPRDSKYRIDLGVALLYAGRFMAAAETFEQAIPYDEDTGIALNNAGGSYYLAGQYGQANELFRDAAAANDKDFAFWGNLGDTCRHWEGCSDDPSHYYLRALELLEVELAIKPNDPELLAVSGQYLMRLGRVEEGRSAIQRALSERPGAKTVLDAALGYAAIGETGRASELTRQAIALGYPEVFARALPDLGSLPVFANAQSEQETGE
ncbi:MAG: tetratricopeptide repeat protein [Gammaproteobacteria bacterium]|jgi:TolB-like protein/DNA-binding winged helix-turn-helix (wHTH) protein/Tfp pilus assembly protein PilF|nr:tetratricopeptide repeat protein [Gammaproteobacteria bacterium]